VGVGEVGGADTAWKQARRQLHGGGRRGAEPERRRRILAREVVWVHADALPAASELKVVVATRQRPGIAQLVGVRVASLRQESRGRAPGAPAADRVDEIQIGVVQDAAA